MKTGQKKNTRIGISIGAAVGILALAAGGYFVCQGRTPKGYQDYIVQKEQYYVEYSDQYDYWDVITVEYPVLSGIGEEQTEAVNKLLYDTAMEKVNFWHLFPDAEVKELQKKYKIYSSDVRCEVPFHSQYLMSVHFQETYAPISPVNYVHKTQRSVNVNLMTGEQYLLSDIFEMNDDFMGLWCEQVEAEGAYGDLIVNDEDTRETFLMWFLDEDEEAGESYLFTPFFYMDEDKNFVIGLSYDPKPSKVVNDLPVNNSFFAYFESADLMPYRTDSEFWDWYGQSGNAGEILACEDLQDNLWLGKDAGVWDYLERVRGKKID
ncbi:MAG: hypothetical protein K2N44_02475 [Lachnospiraceae bacterium]|nr:hypothetical protein [Lachnospiraceae bacterium]